MLREKDLNNIPCQETLKVYNFIKTVKNWFVNILKLPLQDVIVLT